MTDVTGGDWTPDDRLLIPVQGGTPTSKVTGRAEHSCSHGGAGICASDCPTQVGQETPSPKGGWLWQPPTHRRNSGRTPQPPGNAPTTSRPF